MLVVALTAFLLALSRKHPTEGETATALDWAAAIVTLNDLRKFVRPPTEPGAWWFSHMGGMLGSYIATVTAFSAVNFTFLPITARWLWPTAVGVPGIIMWIAYSRREGAVQTRRL